MVNADYKCPRCGGAAGAHFAFCFIAQAWERLMGPQYPWQMLPEPVPDVGRALAQELAAAQADLAAAKADLQAQLSVKQDDGALIVSNELDADALRSIAGVGRPEDAVAPEPVDDTDLTAEQVAILLDQGEPVEVNAEPPGLDDPPWNFTPEQKQWAADILYDHRLRWQDLAVMAQTDPATLSGLANGHRQIRATYRRIVDALRKLAATPPVRPVEEPSPQQKLAELLPEQAVEEGPYLPPEGLSAPQRADAYRDAVVQFLADCCDTAPSTSYVTMRRLTEAYDRWRQEHPDRPSMGNGSTMSGWLQKLGYRRRKPSVNGVQQVAFYGLRLKSHAEWAQGAAPLPEPEQPERQQPHRFGVSAASAEHAQKLAADQRAKFGPLVRQFADACITITGNEREHRVRGDELRAAYDLWAEAHHLPTLTDREFGMGMSTLALPKRQVKLQKPDGGMHAPIHYLGVQLKPEDLWSTPPEPEPEPEVEAEPRPEWMKPEDGYPQAPPSNYDGDQPGGEIPPDYKTKIVLPLIEQGWTYRRRNANGGGKPRVTSPAGKTFSLASTPSDVRGIKNTMATLRRMGARI